jgi:hypothetical protein
MRIVVCTHSYLLLVTLEETPKVDMSDTAFAVEEVDWLDDGYFDGCDVTSDGKLIVAAQKTDPWSGMSPCVFRWYDQDAITYIPEIRGDVIYDPHQITSGYKDSSLWCTSTADNAIVVKALHDTDDSCKLYFLPGCILNDWNHINSIFIPDTEEESDVVYTVWHNLGATNSTINKHSFIPMNLLRITDMMEVPHSGIHNVIVEDDDTFYYNASNDGKVVRGKWATEEYAEIEIGEGWHPKGMCATDRYLICGYSEHAVETPRRYVSQSGLVVIDKKSWELVARLPIMLDGRTVGNINEVRLFG